jgi:hypothetical protein
MMASAFCRKSSRRWWSLEEVQPEGRGGDDDILPSAEMARLVEINGRSMGKDGAAISSSQEVLVSQAEFFANATLVKAEAPLHRSVRVSGFLRIYDNRSRINFVRDRAHSYGIRA